MQIKPEVLDGLLLEIKQPPDEKVALDNQLVGDAVY